MSVFKKKGFGVFIIIILIALITAYLSHMGNNPVSRTVNAVLTPVETQIAKLFNPIKEYFVSIKEAKEIKKQNSELKAENIELQSKVKSIEEYKRENDRLQKLLSISEEMTESETVAAKVIAYEPDNWFTYITINRGTASGIEISDAVITADGLLGQVADAGKNWAKVSTIINSESSSGVRIVRNGEIGIVEGDSSLSKVQKCKLGYLVANASVMPGDILETSGLGGIYPPGLKVGKIAEVAKDNIGRLDYAVVEPFVNFDELYEVLVITDWTLDSDTYDPSADSSAGDYIPVETPTPSENPLPTPTPEENVG